MKVINKYAIFQHGAYQLTLPPGSRIVHVGTLGDGSVNVWVEHELDDIGDPEYHHLEVIPTGVTYNQSSRHIGTFINGTDVYHLIDHTVR